MHVYVSSYTSSCLISKLHSSHTLHIVSSVPHAARQNGPVTKHETATETYQTKPTMDKLILLTWYYRKLVFVMEADAINYTKGIASNLLPGDTIKQMSVISPQLSYWIGDFDGRRMWNKTRVGCTGMFCMA